MDTEAACHLSKIFTRSDGRSNATWRARHHHGRDGDAMLAQIPEARCDRSTFRWCARALNIPLWEG